MTLDQSTAPYNSMRFSFLSERLYALYFILWSLFVHRGSYLQRLYQEKNGSSMDSLLQAQNADSQTAPNLACRQGSAKLVDAVF